MLSVERVGRLQLVCPMVRSPSVRLRVAVIDGLDMISPWHVNAAPFHRCGVAV